MKYILLLLLVTASSLSIAQERITQFENYGQGGRILLADYLDKNYLLNISLDDVLTVYEVVDYNLIELHKNRFVGINNYINLEVFKCFFLFQTSEGSMAYNIVDNSTMYFYYEGENNSTFWKPVNEEEVLLRHSPSFSGLSDKFLINLWNDERFALPYRSNLIGASDSFSCIYKYESLVNSELILKNRKSNDSIRLFIQYPDYFQVRFDKNNIVYQDGLDIIMFNNEDFQADTIMRIPAINRNVKIFKASELSLIFIENEDQEVELYSYDQNGMLISSVQSDFMPIDIYPELVNDILFFQVTSDNIESINIHSGASKSFSPSWSKFDEYVNVQEDYIISFRYDRLHVVNLNTLEETFLEWPVQNGFYAISSFSKDNRSTICLGRRSFNTSNDLIEFTPVTFKASGLIDSFKVGLTTEAQLITDDSGSTVLFDNDVYTLSGAMIEKVNNLPIWGRGDSDLMRIYEDKSCWLEKNNNQLEVKCIGNEFVTAFGAMPNTKATTSGVDELSEFEVCNEKIYFLIEDHTSENRLYEYDSETKMSRLVTIIEYIPYDKLFSIQNKPYFIIEESVHTLDDLGNVVDLEIPSHKFRTYNSSVTYQGEIYLIGQEGIYSIDGDEVNLFLPTEGYSFLRLQVVSNRLLIRSGQYKYTIFDGSSLQDIQLADGDYLYHLSNEYFSIQGGFGGEQNPRLLNVNNLEIFDLGDNFNGRRILDIFIQNGSTYIVSRKDDSYLNTLHVDLVDENYHIVESIHQEELAGYYTVEDILIEEDGVILYVNNSIFSIGEDQIVETYDNIIGHMVNNGFHSNSETAYFIAIDPKYGRQVFSTSNEEENNPPNPVMQSILFPNPTDGILKWNMESDFTSLSVFSVDGALVMSMPIQDVTNLNFTDYPTGLYLVMLCKGDDCETHKLIKVTK